MSKATHLIVSFILGFGMMMAVLSGLSGVRLSIVTPAAEAATVNQNHDRLDWASNRDNLSPRDTISNTTTGELDPQDEDPLVYLPIILGQPGSIGPNQVRYVATIGIDGANPCNDLNNPCLTVQHAVDVAIPGDEIRVAAGTYAGVTHRVGTDQTVYLFKSLTIRGGFTTTDWSTPDPAAHVTILNAQGQGRVFKITEPISVTIEGLLLTGGNGSGDFGGGVYAKGATVTFRDNRVLTNTASIGGGLFLTDSEVRFERNVIARNAATNSGGGVVIGPASEARFINNYVTNNQTIGHGGGLILSGTLAALTNTMITDNHAGLDAGGLSIENSTARLWHTTIANNSGPGSGVAVDGDSTAALTNTILVSHTVGISAAAGGTATLEATVWTGNTTKWFGPGTIEIGSQNFIGNLFFADPGGGDYRLGYRFSSAVDRGVSTSVTQDFEGETRPMNNAPDIGADEYISICPPDCNAPYPIIAWIQDEFGDMTEPAGGTIFVAVERHLSNMTYDLWFSSNPTHRVSFVTDNLGKATINYTIPGSIPSGVYSIYTTLAGDTTPVASCLQDLPVNAPCFTVTGARARIVARNIGSLEQPINPARWPISSSIPIYLLDHDVNLNYAMTFNGDPADLAPGELLFDGSPTTTIPTDGTYGTNLGNKPAYYIATNHGEETLQIGSGIAATTVQLNRPVIDIAGETPTTTHPDGDILSIRLLGLAPEQEYTVYIIDGFDLSTGVTVDEDGELAMYYIVPPGLHEPGTPAVPVEIYVLDRNRGPNPNKIVRRTFYVENP